jgi:hypothetical protein
MESGDSWLRTAKPTMNPTHVDDADELAYTARATPDRILEPEQIANVREPDARPAQIRRSAPTAPNPD